MYKFILFAMFLLMSIGLISCSVDENPIISEPVQTELSVFVTVQPLSTWRTIDTWTFWTTPIEVPFNTAVSSEGGSSISSKDHAHQLSTSNEDGEDILVGTAEVSGMTITVKIENGKDMFQMEHGGDMHEHHAESGDHHVEVNIAETATGHHAHGSAVVPYSEITIIAISESTGDTTEIELNGVQGGHGYRYESNAYLPYDEYDLHVEVEPPSFYRHEETQAKWIEHAEFEFHEWIFDGANFGTIGSGFWEGTGGDSLEISLRSGSVKTYGAVGIGEIPLEGNENVNFSVKLSDPQTEAHAQPLFEAVVNVSVYNKSTEETVSSLLVPMWGDHGFHFAQNMMLNLGQVSGGEEHNDDGGHGH
jgi:uncharacterized protein involved in high-affinity Fe2+ transport